MFKSLEPESEEEYVDFPKDGPEEVLMDDAEELQDPPEIVHSREPRVKASKSFNLSSG